MTYENQKKIINAAKAIKKICKSCSFCENCVMYDENNCLIGFRSEDPYDWKIPELYKWTPEDIILAKGLKEFGVTHIIRELHDSCYWSDEKHKRKGWLPPEAFCALKNNNKISIDDIIKEERENK